MASGSLTSTRRSPREARRRRPSSPAFLVDEALPAGHDASARRGVGKAEAFDDGLRTASSPSRLLKKASMKRRPPGRQGRQARNPRGLGLSSPGVFGVLAVQSPSSVASVWIIAMAGACATFSGCGSSTEPRQVPSLSADSGPSRDVIAGNDSGEADSSVDAAKWEDASDPSCKAGTGTVVVDLAFTGGAQCDCSWTNGTGASDTYGSASGPGFTVSCIPVGSYDLTCTCGPRLPNGWCMATASFFVTPGTTEVQVVEYGCPT